MSDIIIQGARENNLKNINVRIPRGRLTVALHLKSEKIAFKIRKNQSV